MEKMVSVGQQIWIRLAQDPKTWYRGKVKRIFTGFKDNEKQEVDLDGNRSRITLFCWVEHHSDEQRPVRLWAGRGVAKGWDEVSLAQMRPKVDDEQMEGRDGNND